MKRKRIASGQPPAPWACARLDGVFGRRRPADVGHCGASSAADRYQGRPHHFGGASAHRRRRDPHSGRSNSGRGQGPDDSQRLQGDRRHRQGDYAGIHRGAQFAGHGSGQRTQQQRAVSVRDGRDRSRSRILRRLPAQWGHHGRRGSGRRHHDRRASRDHQNGRRHRRSDGGQAPGGGEDLPEARRRSQPHEPIGFPAKRTRQRSRRDSGRIRQAESRRGWRRGRR